MQLDVRSSLPLVYLFLVLVAPVGTINAQDHSLIDADSAVIAAYLPVEIGNIWEYAVHDSYSLPPTGPPSGYRVYEVAGDTVVAGESFWTVLFAWYDDDLGLALSRKLLLRRDSLGQALIRGDDRKAVSFLSPLAVNPGYETEEIAVSRDTTVHVGGSSYVLESVRMTRFTGSYSDFDERVHGYGIGLLSSSSCGLSCSGPPPRYLLVYAVVDDVTYGTSVVATGTGDVRRTRTRSLLVYPSPTRSTIHVAVDDAVTNSTIDLTIFDLLGRHIRTIKLRGRGAPNVEVDVADLPAGVYFIRGDTGAGSVGKSFVVVRD